jgi:hypothetical protein
MRSTKASETLGPAPSCRARDRRPRRSSVSPALGARLSPPSRAFFLHPSCGMAARGRAGSLIVASAPIGRGLRQMS